MSQKDTSLRSPVSCGAPARAEVMHGRCCIWPVGLAMHAITPSPAAFEDMHMHGQSLGAYAIYSCCVHTAWAGHASDPASPCIESTTKCIGITTIH
jgi:hypothetical protein